jgi:hypothetical protein
MTIMSPRRLRALLWRLGAGLLALSVAVIVTSLVERRMQALGQPVAVLVAREAIPAYTAIRPDDMQVIRLPAAAVAEGALRDPAELEGRLARVEIPPGVPLYRQQVVPASDLRYTTDGRAVILALAVLPAHAPSNLLKPGQRVDVWTDGSIIAGGLRVVAVSSLSDGRLAVAVEAGQEVTPQLLTSSSRTDLALTLSPLERLPTPTALPVTATPTHAPTVTVTRSVPTPPPTATTSPTISSTPGVAVVKPGPAQGLNVRAGPGIGYPVLATLRAGSRLTPVGRDAEGRWVEVCCVADDQAGWVLAELVDLEVDLAGLPVR